MAVVIESTGRAHNGGTNQTTLAIPKPADTVENDVLLAILFSRDDDGANSYTTLTGWTPIVFQGKDTGSANTMIGAFFKEAGASEGASYTWTQAESRRFGGWIHRITGLDASDLVDVSAGVEDQSFNEFADIPSVTPTVTDGWLYGAVAGASAVAVTAAPSGMTLAEELSDIANAVNGGGAFEQLTTDDATGVRLFAADWGRAVGIAFVLKQAGVGVDPANLQASVLNEDVTLTWDV